MTEQEFERYWKQNSAQILQSNAEYQAVKANGRKHEIAIIAVMVISFVIGNETMNLLPFTNELLKWLVGAVIIIVLLVAGFLLKTKLMGPSPSMIEQKIKEQTKKQMLEK